jgi:NAD(P)-dependent dehydrogenase (short-subunit alcohol dehydrogenase family)
MISPGPIVFPGGNWSKVKEAKPDFYDMTEAQMVLGRFGTPDDVAKTVVFISSPASNYTTGTNVIIDGGYTKRVQF